MNENELAGIFNEYIKLKNLYDKLRPFKINLSRKLSGYLRIKEFLNNFITLINQQLKNGLHDNLSNESTIMYDEKTEIFDQYKDIDILLKMADIRIIIEDKIQGTIDQDSQTERYVQCMIDEKINPKNIFVLHLTETSDKKPSAYSLTEKVKKIWII